MKDFILKIFEKAYGDTKGAEVYFAPGRVNLIGEHTDYNGGHVFPCALALGTYCGVRKRDDNVIRLYSDNFENEGIYTCRLGEFETVDGPEWCRYPVGVLWTLGKKGFVPDKGMDIVYYGNIPAGAGLSSSASIEVLTAYFLKELFGWDISMVDIALLCQYSENNYNGTKCGIMDQFASAMGKKDNAIFLDTNTLKYEYEPVILDDKVILIINTNKKHKLVESEYNTRRAESEEALKRLKTELDINTLGDLDNETFEKHIACIGDDILIRRARHAVSENQRTILAAKALRDNDIAEFGKLMVQSHVSLRDDYEVSCKELDIIVEEALKEEGIWGIRMTGGGFGGCCVGIADTDKADLISENVKKAYYERTGIRADVYNVSIGDGPHKVV